jgi:hypothetical protein
VDKQINGILSPTQKNEGNSDRDYNMDEYAK